MTRRPKAAEKHHERAAPFIAERQPTYELVGLALILLATLLVYLPALHGGKLVDDDGNITPRNLRPVSGLYHIWCDPRATAQYYPILHTAFWLEHRLWGDSFLGYHLVTLFWHSISVTLVYFILQRLKVPGALLAAAIFALHPVMVESVAWMCEQKNTLSTVFYLSAVLLYLHFDESRQRSRYFLALGLFALALLTKSITVTLPAALLVIFWWQRGRVSWQRDVLPLVPFFAVGAAFGMVTIWVERTYFRGADADFTLTLAQRFLLAGRAIWFYAGKLVWPADLMFTYPRWTIDLTQWWQWTFPIAVFATTFALWAIRKRWRAPLAGWLFFCGTLLPAIGFANFYMFVITFVADHLQYLASLGLIVLAAAAIAQGFARLPQPKRRAGAALCILLVGILAALSRQQSRLYGDVVTFYQAVLAFNPNSWLAHNNLGCELYEQGKLQEAMEHYHAALRFKPDFAMAHRNLGGILAEDGRHSEAIDEYRAALKLDHSDPETLNGLGLALVNTGHAEEAIEHLNRAIHLQPEYAQAHNNLGMALGDMNKTAEAIAEFQRALEISQAYANPHNNWGIVLSRLGQNSAAIEQFRQALHLNPNDANCQFNLAALLTEAGQGEEAIPHLEQAIRVRPSFAEAHMELAKTLASAGRSDEAIATAQRGIAATQSAGKQAAAEQLDEWLKQYRIELQRAANPESTDSPAPGLEPTKTQ